MDVIQLLEKHEEEIVEKATLTTTYVSLAGNTKIPTLDLSSLFKFK